MNFILNKILFPLGIFLLQIIFFPLGLFWAIILMVFFGNERNSDINYLEHAL